MTGFFIFIILFVIVAILFSDKPDLLFWISLMMYFDPGGFAAGYFSTGLIGRLTISDIAIVFMLFATYNRFGRFPAFYIASDDFNRFNKRILLYLVISFLAMYGIIMPIINGYSNPSMFFLKNRHMLYGWIILVLSFTFHLHDKKNFFLKIIIYSTVIIMPFYFLSLISPIKIVPAYSIERFEGSGIMRQGILSYGFMHYSYYILLVVMMLGWNNRARILICSRNLILIAGTFMMLEFIVGLTRRIIISTLFSMFTIWWLTGKLRKESFGITRIGKVLIPAMMAFLFLFAFLPQYIGWFTNITENTVVLMLTGSDTKGRTDARISGGGGLPLAVEYIKKHPLFGSGYYPVSFEELIQQEINGNKFAYGYDDSAEVPIYAVPLRLGVFGVLFIISIYIVVIRTSIKVFRLLKNNFVFVLKNHYPELLIVIFILGLIITSFTIELPLLGGEFINVDMFPGSCVIMGIFFATIYKLESSVTREKLKK